MEPTWIDRATVTIRSPAKLNLFLEVLGKRPDGYHELDMLMEAIDLCDTITATTETAAGIEIATDAAGIPTGPENVVWRAAELFFAASGIAPRVRFFMEKRIPAGGGLGGGSGNAVAALYALMELFHVELPEADLFAMACRLGSDVPFFLGGGLARCRGRGEKVEILGAGAPRRYLIAVPPFPLSTAQVYSRLAFPLTSPRHLGTMSLASVEQGLQSGELFFNRLEEPAFALEPSLRELREGARAEGVSLMLTGSGSCMFGVISEDTDVSKLSRRSGWIEGRVAVRTARNLQPWKKGRRKEGERADHGRTDSPGRGWG